MLQRKAPSSSWLAVVLATTITAPFATGQVTQQAYVKASNPDFNDRFGVSVAVSGDTMVVGSYLEASAATGVNGNDSDNSTPNAGAAYVYVRNGSTWSQQAYLKASNTNAYDQFGWTVGIDGDTIVVGAVGEASSATGVGGNQLDNSAPGSGAAYVFTRNGTTWSQQAYLKASNSEAGDQFGAVSISGDTILVGAYFEDSSSAGVGGNQADNSLTDSGAAYVFKRNGTTWSQEAYLKASNPGSVFLGDRFGNATALSGDTAVVAAIWEDSASTGVNGNQASDSARDAGAAYVFVRNGSTWSQEAYLKASNTDTFDNFGGKVGISGDTIVVGATGEDSGAAGVNGNSSDNGSPTAGAAYVFQRSGTVWAQEAYLKSSNPDAGDAFGWDIGIFGNRIAVGAVLEDSSATGVGGNQSLNDAPSSGAAYEFERNGSTWTQTSYIKPSNGETADYFGFAVDVAGDLIACASVLEDGGSAGVNGPDNNGAANSGAVYVFDQPTTSGPIGTGYCFGDGSGAACPCGNFGGLGEGCATSTGSGMTIALSGSASIAADDMIVTAAGIPLNNAGIFFAAQGQTGGAPLFDGLLCISGPNIRFQGQFASTGTVSNTNLVAKDYTGSFWMPGSTYGLQYYSRDNQSGSSPCGSSINLTHGVAVTMAP